MKVPAAKRLPSGNWNIRLRLGGEEISITRSSETACKQEAQLVKAEYLAGKRMTLSQAAKETTLHDAARRYIDRNKALLSPATVRSYECYLRARFIKYKYKTLPEIDWQRMINDELAVVSEKTVKNAWALFRPAVEAAGFPVPKVRLAKVPVRDLPWLQPDEILRFCEAVRGRPFEIAALLELHGLRLSEVKGLRWDQVDLKRDRITVRGAMVRGPEGYVLKATNKTETSTRTVPVMIPQLHAALAAVPEQQRSGLVVKQGAGTLLDDVKRTCRRAGITETGNHGLRRSFASLCYDRGINEEQLKAWGGWQDYQTMHKIYIKLAAASEQAARDRVKAFFQNADENADGLKKAP